MNVDMTEGKILSKMMKFFLPIFWGGFLQQIYQMTDALIVGWFNGKVAFGALDVTGNFIRLPLVLFMGLATGASIVIAQSYGGHNDKRLKDSLHTMIAFGVVAGILMSILMVLLTPAMTAIMQVPEEMVPYTQRYMYSLFGGMVFSFLYNMGYGILRALGDSKRPFQYLVISLVINVVLDFLLVGAMKLDTLGAGIATIMSQAVTTVLVLRAMTKLDPVYALNRQDVKISKNHLREILILGMPIALQSMAYPFTNIFTQRIINSYGTDMVVAWGVVGKIDFLVWMLIDAIAVTVSTFVAQNFGAKNYERIHDGMRVGAGLMFAMVIPVSIFLYYFGAPIGRIFVRDPEPLRIVTMIFQVVFAPYFIFQAVGDLLAGAIRGTGNTLHPMLIYSIAISGFRLVWIFFIYPLAPSELMTLLSFPISWALMGITVVIYYFTAHRRRMARLAETA